MHNGCIANRIQPATLCGASEATNQKGISDAQHTHTLSLSRISPAAVRLLLTGIMVTAMTSTAFAQGQQPPRPQEVPLVVDQPETLPATHGHASDYKLRYELQRTDYSGGGPPETIFTAMEDAGSDKYNNSNWVGVFALFSIPGNNPGEAIYYNYSKTNWQKYYFNEEHEEWKWKVVH